MREHGTACRKLLTPFLAGAVAFTAFAVPARAQTPPPLGKNLKVEDLGTPLMRRKLGTAFVYRAPGTGHLRLFMTLTAANGLGGDPPFQILDFNLETGKVLSAMGCEGSGGRAWLHSNGKLYMGQVRPPMLTEWDPATGKARTVGRMTENYFHGTQSVDEGPDGAFYQGLYGRHVSRYDPKTDKLEDLGVMGDSESGYVYSIGADGRYVYCGISDSGKWYLVVYNLADKTQETFFKPKEGEPAPGGSVTRATDGNLYFGGHLLKDGKPVKPDSPARVAPAPKSEVWDLPSVEKALDLELDVDGIQPDTWNKGAVTLRWRKKGDAEWRSTSFRGVDLQPNTVHRMAATPDGKLICFGAWYGPIFLFDPQTRKTTPLGPAPGSVYDMLFAGDKAYFCGYSSMFAVYDRTKPWTLSPKNEWYSKEQNPYRLPAAKWTTNLALGADGRVYLAGYNARHSFNGLLGTFDPATGKLETMEEPFKAHYIRDMCSLDGGRLLVLSSASIGGKGEGKLFVYDTQARKLTGECVPLPGSPHTGLLFAAGPNAVIGVQRQGKKDEAGNDVFEFAIYKVDVTTGKTLFRETHPGRAFAGPSEFDFDSDNSRFALGPDGCGWFFVDKTLTRVHPADGRLEKVLTMESAGRLVFIGKDLYVYNGGRQWFGGFSRILRVRNVVQ